MSMWLVVIGFGILLCVGSQFLRQHWVLAPVRVILFWVGTFVVLNSIFMCLIGQKVTVLSE